ncbi:MAG: peptidylprolyl isomerase [Gammaproteobacteria bacterium]|nr:peptidylprolyl isomerase [Gammaproteobacteria bacterium]
MLQQIRERAQGWIAWFIVILISVPFALWGIQEYLGVGSEPVAATVNGQEITDREFETGYRNFRQRLRQQLGANYRPELIDEARMREEVLESMIQNQLVLQASSNMGLGAGDNMVRAMIVSIPGFTIAGRFDQQAYERALRSRGQTPVGFEDQIRRALISEQFSKSVTSSEFTTDAEMERQVQLTRQQREFDYLLIESKPFQEAADVGEDEIKTYYNGHPNEFMAPERVKVEYLDLHIENISKTLAAEEEDLLGYYELNKNSYVSPEQRKASHILISVEEGADDKVVEEARKTITEALSRINGGESFAEVARELSQDSGSASQGGDLGYFERGVMDQAFEDTVFRLNVDQVSDPVKSAFGFHAIKLTGIRPSTGKSYEEMKDEIRSAFLKSEAERLFYEYAERLNDLAYEDPNSLQPAAEALGMTTQTSDWLEHDGNDGVFASSKVTSAAFSDDVLFERNNSEAIEVAPEHVVVLRVVEHEEAAVRPLDSVKEEITSRLKGEKASEMASRKGEKILEIVKQDNTLSAVADAEGLEVTSKGLVDRNQYALPPKLRQELFRMPRPDGENPRFAGSALANGDYAIIALHSVKDGSLDQESDTTDAQTLRSSQNRTRGSTYFNHLLDNLRADAKIEIASQLEAEQ